MDETSDQNWQPAEDLRGPQLLALIEELRAHYCKPDEMSPHSIQETPFRRKFTFCACGGVETRVALFEAPLRVHSVALHPLHPPLLICYVAPCLMKEVNIYLRTHFWQGIDMESQLIPDNMATSLIAIDPTATSSTEAVVGLLLLTNNDKPDEWYMEYVATHSRLEGCGLATGMIQAMAHLPQALHVRTTNPALWLYLALGFEPQAYLYFFYDKYFPKDSKLCRNAIRMVRRGTDGS